jgi:lipid A 3-O-deacylase
MKWNRLVYWCVLVVSVIRTEMAFGQTFDQGPVLVVQEENDEVARRDRHYTQGFRGTFMHSDGYLPFGSKALYEGLPEFGFRSAVGKFGYSLGQNIYTPANVFRRTLVPEERPYGGLLYAGLILQRRGLDPWGYLAQEDFGLDLGVIGPWSMAEQVQCDWHSANGYYVPQGWDHQLKNEPAIRLKYSRAHLYRTQFRDNFQFDFIPRLGLSLGNIDTSVRLGSTFRFGYRIPDNFGPQIIDSLTVASGGRSRSQRQKWGAYVHAGAEARAVFFNPFVDGNLFRSSHSVDKEMLVGDLKGGIAFTFDRWEVGYTHVLRSREYVGQRGTDEFGSIFVKVKF